MASIQELHEVIHTMSKYEKSQLNIYINAISGKSKDKYLNDYQCFVKQKVFDKEKLKTKLNKIEIRKNLSESNTNLYNFINESLINVNQKKILKISLLKEIQIIELLNDRSLIEQANKALIKTKQKCEEAEMHSLLFLIMKIEEEIHSKLPKSNKPLNVQIEQIEHQIEYVERYNFQLKFRKLRKQIFVLAGEIGTPRNQEQKDKYLALADNEVMSIDPEIIRDDMLKEYYLTKILLISVIAPEVEKILQVVDEGLVKVQNAFSRSQNISPEFLLTRIALETSITAKKESILDARLSAFENLQEHIVSLRGKALFTSKLQWAYLLKYLNTNKIEEGAKYINQNKAKIVGSDLQKLSPQTYINFITCARICFLNKDYKQSLEFVELLLEKKKVIRKSLLSHIYCLYLLNHYRLNNTSYLPYALRSVYRSLLHLEQIYEPEKALLHFLKKSTNPLILKAEMKILYDKLVLLSDDSFHNSFFGNGDYLTWLQREIED
jgi:hypothetical protein